VFTKATQDDVVVVEDAGHWVHFDKPQETKQLINDFLFKLD